MDKTTLPEYPPILKHPHQKQEELFQALCGMETLLEELLEKDFATYPLARLNDFLLITLDLLQKAKQLSQALLEASALLEEAPD